MTQAQNDYWFRPKLYGYGAEPSNWKGWLATLAFIAVLLAISLPFMIWPALDETLTAVDVALWAALMLAVIGPFLWFCWLKTDGKWGWHWGTRD